MNDGIKTLSIANSKISIDKLKERYSPKLESIISKWYEPTEKRFDYLSKFALAGEMLIKQYTIHAGNQD